MRGWGAKSAAIVLARYEHLENIPNNEETWDVSVRGAPRLARSLTEAWDEALLFRDLATLRTTSKVFVDVDELRWTGPAPEFFTFCARINASGYFRRAQGAADKHQL